MEKEKLKVSKKLLISKIGNLSVDRIRGLFKKGYIVMNPIYKFLDIFLVILTLLLSVPQGLSNATAPPIERKPELDTAVSQQKILLNEAQRLINDRKYDEASKLIREVVNKAKAPEILASADALLKKARPKCLDLFYFPGSKILTWIIYLACSLFALLISYGILRFVRFLYCQTGRRKKVWLISEIVDQTGQGIGELIASALFQWKERKPCITASLLLPETTRSLKTPEFVLPTKEIDFSLAAEALPPVANVPYAALAKFFKVLPEWFNANRAQVRGRVSIANGMYIAFLSCRKRVGELKTVSSQCSATQRDAILILTEELSYKLFFLLSSDCSLHDVEMANELRKGIALLDDYSRGENPEGLQKACRVFGRLRRMSPTNYEAHLFEGIALDLLEKHSEAAKKFGFVKNRAIEESLKEKAAYNEAISYLRKYEPWAEVQKAINLLDKLIGEVSEIEKGSPVKAFALAAKADAIAFKPRSWYEIPTKLPVNQDDSVTLKQKESRLPMVEGSIEEVEGISLRLQKMIGTLRTSKEQTAGGWDDLAIRQLEWAVHLALGDLYINSADKFLRPPYLPEPFGEAKRNEFLGKAEREFQECELLLPAGCEIFSLLGAVCQLQGRFNEAEEYLKEAVKLNPLYEYAFYRLAQTYEKKKKKDLARDTIIAFKGTPKISGFLKLYDKYRIKR